MKATHLIVWTLKRLLLISLPTCLILVGLLDVFFRVVIPASDRPYAIYDKNWKLLRYEVTRGTRGLYTAGHLAQLRKWWRINNEGWNSEIDYKPEKTGRTRIAVIGDSFIEAFQVTPDESIAAVVRRQLGDRFEMYSFGFSGSPLSHYVQVARYVNRVFDPDIVVFNVVPNDFRQSLCEIQYAPGLRCYAERDGQFVEAEVLPYIPNPVKRLSRHSALIRYWYHNLGGRINLWFFTKTFDVNEQPFILGADPEEVRRLQQKIDAVIGIILRTIKMEAQHRRVIVMLTTDQFYDVDDLRKTEYWWMHEMLARHCAENHVEFLDLDVVLKAHYDVHQLKFESPYDSHWNELGHRIAGETLAKTIRTPGARVASGVSSRDSR